VYCIPAFLLPRDENPSPEAEAEAEAEAESASGGMMGAIERLASKTCKWRKSVSAIEGERVCV